MLTELAGMHVSNHPVHPKYFPLFLEFKFVKRKQDGSCYAFLGGSPQIGVIEPYSACTVLLGDWEFFIFSD